MILETGMKVKLTAETLRKLNLQDIDYTITQLYDSVEVQSLDTDLCNCDLCYVFLTESNFEFCLNDIIIDD